MVTDTKNTVLVDGQSVAIEGEVNLLTLIRKAGIELPTLCYHPELSIYGACRLCVVEQEGRGLVAACSTPPMPGMTIFTNSPRVQRSRRIVLELLLSNHDRECTTCDKSGKCKLQELSERYGVRQLRYGDRTETLPLDISGTSLVRDPNKCILCGCCVRACSEVQGIGILNFVNRGSKAQVAPAFKKDLAEVDCVNCGQCSAVCPTGALVVKPELNDAYTALNDPDKLVVVQVAPAVRVALGDEFGLPSGELVTGKLVTALRRLGFDHVFDTCFAADVTIMEEATELIKRLTTDQPGPMFTSCCPAWVKYAEHRGSEQLLQQLSTTRSPQQIFGSLMKRYWAKELGKKPQDIYMVSIMPCTAKKFEHKREEFSVDGVPDVDLVLTTQELGRMIRAAGMDLAQLEPSEFDLPFGVHTGAGVIFGATGGVMEAALRAAYEMITGEVLKNVEFKAVRGFEGLKEFSVDLKGREVKVAVVHGLANADNLLERLDAGTASYDFVEVMSCPGGCINGAGQPQSFVPETKQARSQGIYQADEMSQLRKSQDNPVVAKVYKDWLTEPNSHEAHHTLHTVYLNRKETIK